MYSSLFKHSQPVLAQAKFLAAEFEVIRSPREGAPPLTRALQGKGRFKAILPLGAAQHDLAAAAAGVRGRRPALPVVAGGDDSRFARLGVWPAASAVRARGGRHGGAGAVVCVVGAALRKPRPRA